MKRNRFHNGYFLWIVVEQRLGRSMYEIWLIFYLQSVGFTNSSSRWKWVYNFINRQPELKIPFSWRYSYRRAKREDLKVVHQWSDCSTDYYSVWYPIWRYLQLWWDRLCDGPYIDSESCYSIRVIWPAINFTAWKSGVGDYYWVNQCIWMGCFHHALS